MAQFDKEDVEPWFEIHNGDEVIDTYKTLEAAKKGVEALLESDVAEGEVDASYYIVESRRLFLAQAEVKTEAKFIKVE